ncbi:MAG: type 2 isopentenyl-diphosphate Delta-isomerase [Anaerolineales bacterium]|jgi:isopentenyl-diphosphate delta-isomerase
MEKVTQIESRKSEHIRINLEEDVNSGLTTGLENFHFVHRALPELNLEAVDLSTRVFNKPLKAPLLISSMTGGTSEAETINQRLAEAAQAAGIAIGVGSQRAAIENPELARTFMIRQVAPDALILANLGAVQLNYGYGLEECQRAVDMLAADALILHFNALQEAVQPEGDGNFAGLADKVAKICSRLPVPVIAKEVGWGFSEADVRLLMEAGVSAIDVAGAGGTSWSQVEMHRAKNDSQRRLAAAFLNWGIPTSQAIQNVRRAAPDLLIFASGGLRSGIDIAKCLALGAALGGMAGPFLKAASQSAQAVFTTLEEVTRELQICMFAAGAGDLAALQQTQLVQRQKD